MDNKKIWGAALAVAMLALGTVGQVRADTPGGTGTVNGTSLSGEATQPAACALGDNGTSLTGQSPPNSACFMDGGPGVPNGTSLTGEASAEVSFMDGPGGTGTVNGPSLTGEEATQPVACALGDNGTSLTGQNPPNDACFMEGGPTLPNGTALTGTAGE